MSQRPFDGERRRTAADRPRRAGGLAGGLVAIGAVAALGLLDAAASAATPGTALLLTLAALFALTAAGLGGFELGAALTEESARGRGVAVHGVEPAPAPGIGRAAALAATAFSLAIVFSFLAEAARDGLGLERAEERAKSLTDARDAARDPRTRPPKTRNGTGRAGRVLDPERTGRSGSTLLPNLVSTLPVLEVEPLGPGLDPRADAIRLRAFVLSGLDDDGRPAPIRGRIDALTATDGLVVDPFGEARGADATQTVRIRALGETRGLVVAPTPLVSIDLPSARVERSRGVLIGPEERERWTIETEREVFSMARLRALPARAPSGGIDATALPRRGPDGARSRALDRLTREAEAVTRDATSDLERVLGIVRHFRDTFDYDLFDTAFQSPEGCVELIERGTGSCTHFASASMLMLRALGIPTRVVAGYVAREATEAGDAWIVRMRDGHAWIEVYFEGVGWLPFDPTPAAAGAPNPAFAPIGTPPEPPDSPLAALAFRILGPLGAHPVILAALLSLLLLGAALATRGRPSATPPPAQEPPPEVPPPAHAAVARGLMTALARHGLRARPHETPLAFARRADALLQHAEPSDTGGTLGVVVTSLVRAATHGTPLSPADTSRIEALTRSLESRDGTRGP